LARGGISFDGIGAHYTTYALATADTIVEANEGKAVTITDNGEAGYGDAGDVLLGAISKVDGDGYGSIQDAGYMELEYASCTALPALGAPVVVNGAGLVSQSTTAIVGRGNSIVSVEPLAMANHTVIVLLG